MNDFRYEPTGSGFAGPGYGGPGHGGPRYEGPGRGRQPGLVRTALAVLLICMVASLILGSGFWALGLVFHLVGFVLRLALLAALAAFIWRRVVGRRHWL